MVTSYDLRHGYSDLPVHELSALDRSEKVVYIVNLFTVSTSYHCPSQFYGHLVIILSKNEIWCSAVAGYYAVSAGLLFAFCMRSFLPKATSIDVYASFFPKGEHIFDGLSVRHTFVEAYL